MSLLILMNMDFDCATGEGAKGTEEDPKASSADLKAPEESGKH